MINFTLPGRPSSALRHWDVLEYSEVVDSVHARTWSNEKTADMDGLRHSLDDPYYRLGPVHTCLYVRVTWDWWLAPLPRSPGKGEGGNWWSWPMCVIAKGIPRGCQGLFTPCPCDTHYQFSIKTLEKLSVLVCFVLYFCVCAHVCTCM